MRYYLSPATANGLFSKKEIEDFYRQIMRLVYKIPKTVPNSLSDKAYNMTNVIQGIEDFRQRQKTLWPLLGATQQKIKIKGN